MALEVAEPGMQIVADSGDRAYALDGKLYVEFYEHYRYNEQKSKGWDEFVHDGYTAEGEKRYKAVHHDGAGRPIFDLVDYVRIAAPGDRNSIHEQPVDEWFLGHRPILAEKYKKWKESGKGANGISGTPISELPFLHKALVKELQAVNVQTAEQLVAMPDAVAQSFPGINALKQRAEAYLEAAAGRAPMESLRGELALAEERRMDLEKTVAELSRRLAEVEAPPQKQKAK